MMPDVTGAALIALCLVGGVVATYLWSTDAGRQSRALNTLKLLLRARSDGAGADTESANRRTSTSPSGDGGDDVDG